MSNYDWNKEIIEDDNDENGIVVAIDHAVHIKEVHMNKLYSKK